MELGAVGACGDLLYWEGKLPWELFVAEVGILIVDDDVANQRALKLIL